MTKSRRYRVDFVYCISMECIQKQKQKKNRKTKNTKDKNRDSFLATRSSFQMAYSYHHCMQCNSLCDFVAPLFEKQG